MSRCYPFPPPGYMRNGSCGEALIESIKLQRENEKAKKDRKKEKRREKKDKRKDRKEKEGTTSHGSDGKEFKLIELEKSSGCLQKGDYYENEQLERSDITEEHDQPISMSEPCCSDSTQSSNKRKRSTSPSSHDHGEVLEKEKLLSFYCCAWAPLFTPYFGPFPVETGTVIKIRLSLRKHRESEESKLEDQLVSTSASVGTADSFGQDTCGGGHPLLCVTNAERDVCPGNSDSRHCEELQSLPCGAAPNTNLFDDERMRMVSVYNSLFQNWVTPPPTCDGFKSKDQDCLFSSELQEERPVSKKVKAVTGALRCSTASLWPRAQYLPEVE